MGGKLRDFWQNPKSGSVVLPSCEEADCFVLAK